MMSNVKPYRIELHRTVEKFLRRHRDLADKLEAIKARIALSPYSGGPIVHMKDGKWYCSRRWSDSKYRLIYEVSDDERLVHIYHVNNRGQVYR